jgi:hypothetical protein
VDLPELDAALHALYGAPLSDFVKERTRLARDLKAAGDPASASKVAGAAKPTVSAWTINQLWRQHGAELDELFATGEAVHRATGGDVEDFRAATSKQREILTRLRQRADEILRAAGHAPTEPVLRRVSTTLSALAAAGSFAPDRPGQLAADRDPPGFGEVTGQVPPAPESQTRRIGAKDIDARREEERRAKAAAAERDRRIAEARRTLVAKTAARVRAEKELEARAREVERARAALDEAERACVEATRAFERAEREEQAAARALSEASNQPAP